MSRSMAAVNWTVYSMGHNLLTVFGNQNSFRFQCHLTDSRDTTIISRLEITARSMMLRHTAVQGYESFGLTLDIRQGLRLKQLDTVCGTRIFDWITTRTTSAFHLTRCLPGQLSTDDRTRVRTMAGYLWTTSRNSDQYHYLFLCE
jgi:hypothetical protein